MKYCFACKTVHDLSEFSTDKRAKDGLQQSCRASRKKYYAENADYIRQKARNNFRDRRLTAIGRAKILCSAARDRSIKRNIVFDLDPNMIAQIIEIGVCQRSGLRFYLGNATNERRHAFAPSLDRINNNEGYIKGNVQVVCNMYNAGKSEHCEIDFIAMCVAVANIHGQNVHVVARLAELRA